MAKHFVVLKCDGNCPFNDGGFWGFNKKRRYCMGRDKNGRCLGKEIPKGDFKGNLFPEFCPLDDYEVERCDKIQLRKKKMQDHIKRRKRCRR
jgi:hypothetical protein